MDFKKISSWQLLSGVLPATGQLWFWDSLRDHSGVFNEPNCCL